MNDHDQFEDITSELDNVNGGGKVKALWEGAKAAYKAVRPVIKEGSDFVKDLGFVGGAGYALKKGYDYVTGSHPNPAPNPAPQGQP